MKVTADTTMLGWDLIESLKGMLPEEREQWIEDFKAMLDAPKAEEPFLNATKNQNN